MSMLPLVEYDMNTTLEVVDDVAGTVEPARILESLTPPLTTSTANSPVVVKRRPGRPPKASLPAVDAVQLNKSTSPQTVSQLKRSVDVHSSTPSEDAAKRAKHASAALQPPPPPPAMTMMTMSAPTPVMPTLVAAAPLRPPVATTSSTIATLAPPVLAAPTDTVLTMDSLMAIFRTVQANGHFDSRNNFWLSMRTVSDAHLPHVRSMMRCVFWTFKHFCPGMLHASTAAATWMQLIRFAQSPAAARAAFDAAECARLQALSAATSVAPAGFSLASEAAKW